MLGALGGSLVGAYLRKAPRHRGRFQMAKAAFRAIGERPVCGAYGVRLLSNWRDATNILAAIGGPFDDVFSEVDKLKPGMAFVDIGANHGVFSMVAGHRVSRDGVVIAFEPSHSVYRYLVANAALNGLSNFYPFKAAIGPSTGVCSFNDGDTSHTGTGHLSQSGRSIVLQLSANDLESPVSALIGGRRTMIKIDVEGAEAHVLNALRAILSRPHTDVVIVEVDESQMARFGHNKSDLYEPMLKMGYRPRRGAGFSSHFNEVFYR